MTKWIENHNRNLRFYEFVNFHNLKRYALTTTGQHIMLPHTFVTYYIIHSVFHMRKLFQANWRTHFLQRNVN